ncbi:hypothetical protein [Vitreimonas flagellata]|uniref:hypothetical protein n=1 Tax=Vitreimonas flagellata TaxID=2560861 RepID=UPI001074FF2A|nr:hypothetical protein [Vitreimonas flagellata]
MDIALQILGMMVQVAGLAILYLHWRAKRGLGGAVLVAGWALIALGALPWLMHVSIERGLALAMLAPMAAGLFLLAPDALARVGNSATPKKARAAQESLEAESTSPGRLSRNVARWIGALIAAPALALAAMAAWQAFVPGVNADRFAFSIFALMIVWTAATLWLLATMRPWRATLVTTFAAFVLGGGAYLFVLGGAA